MCNLSKAPGARNLPLSWRSGDREGGPTSFWEEPDAPAAQEATRELTTDLEVMPGMKVGEYRIENPLGSGARARRPLRGAPDGQPVAGAQPRLWRDEGEARFSLHFAGAQCTQRSISRLVWFTASSHCSLPTTGPEGSTHTVPPSAVAREPQKVASSEWLSAL